MSDKRDAALGPVVRARLDMAEKYRKAALRVERGWTQGAYARDGYGRPSCFPLGDAFCMIGALSIEYLDDYVESRWHYVRPLGAPPDRFDVRPLLILHPQSSPPDTFGWLSDHACVCAWTCWNDRPERTVAEVAAKLRETADRIERGEA